MIHNSFTATHLHWGQPNGQSGYSLMIHVYPHLTTFTEGVFVCTPFPWKEKIVSSTKSMEMNTMEKEFVKVSKLLFGVIFLFYFFIFGTWWIGAIVVLVGLRIPQWKPVFHIWCNKFPWKKKCFLYLVKKGWMPFQYKFKLINIAKPPLFTGMLSQWNMGNTLVEHQAVLLHSQTMILEGVKRL